MGELAKIESFRKDLALAETIEEIKLLGDAADVYQNLMKKRGIVKNKVDEIGEFIIDIEIKEAEWLNEKHPHGADRKSDNIKVQGTNLDSKMPVTKHESARVRKLKKTKEENPDLFKTINNQIKNSDEILNAKSLYKEIRRQENIENRQKVKEKYDSNIEFKGKIKYRIIYADPPWLYNQGKDLSDKYGDVKKHYPPMELDDICKLPIKELCQKDCVLFLWATAPKLPEALSVMDAWGFQYKTNIVWDKVKHNFGFYFSVRHELLLIGGMGSSTPDIKELHDSVISIERSNKHSEKPSYFRELIDKLYVDGNRIELFAREKIENWDNWGNEL